MASGEWRDRRTIRHRWCSQALCDPGFELAAINFRVEDASSGETFLTTETRAYKKYGVVINREKFLRAEGVLQNQDHGISIKASRVLPVSMTAAETQSHDFH